MESLTISPFWFLKKKLAYLVWIFPTIYNVAEALSKTSLERGKHSSLAFSFMKLLTTSPLGKAYPSSAFTNVDTPVKLNLFMLKVK